MLGAIGIKAKGKLQPALDRTARLLVLLVMLLPTAAGAQRLLDLPQETAFSSAEITAYAARAYGARLHTLSAAAQLDTDPALKARLQRLMPPLERAAAYELPAAAAIDWEIHACSGCDENASALPGGKLLVSADYIARLALTDDELGYLLAHEIGHVLAQHTREFASAARYFVDNGRARGYADIERELGENFSVALRMRPFYAQQELEADRIGFVLGTHAGFTPSAMLGLLAKLDTHERPLINTHPDSEMRIAQARGMLDAMRRLAAQPLRQAPF